MTDLTIITAVYDNPEGLQKTWESLAPLRSSALAWEYLVVDSSPEQHEAQVRKIQSESQGNLSFRRIIGPRAGIYAAFNLGLENSQGNYVWFLNGGDCLNDASALLQSLKILDQNPDAGLLYARARLEREDQPLYLTPQTTNLTWRLLGSNRICQQSVLYRREIFEKTGPFATDLKLASDYEHLLLCQIKKISARFSGDVIARYDMDGSSSRYQDVFKEYKIIHRRLRKNFPLWRQVAHETLRNLDHGRVSLMKTISGSPAGPLLRPLWNVWKRRGSRS